jgi:peptidoglycan/xylan/chitin deacetylase (PgdA/CDA1 family)
MYHRISPPGSTEGISADVFRQQMEMLKRSFNVMTLNELMRFHDNGYTPDNAVVVTFDDGYHDFADYAFPILRELNIPATLFVTTGFVGGDLWLWPDQIRYALDNTKVPKIQLPGVSGSLNIAEEPEQCWHRIADHCMLVSNTEKLTLIDTLFERLDIEKPVTAPAAYRPLTWDQIREMKEQGLEVGSHSHSHPILTQLDDDELRMELAFSREAIQKQLNVATPAFCYPNGQKIDFDARVQAKVREAGYEYAIAAFPGADPLHDRWAVKRYPASQKQGAIEKIVYGMTYLRL